MKVERLTGSNIPVGLRSIHGPPTELYILGNRQVLEGRPLVSVVGTRRPSIYGRQVTKQLVGELASQGVGIVSGLALGIDALAHRACLEAKGVTIAILPTSLDAIYPASHRALAEDIVRQGGALLSEYQNNPQPQKFCFIARNRLVAGLGDGVLITEAAERSGTLHTASFALDQGKSVMAVPGNITSTTSRGTNALLRGGAIPVATTGDILETLSLQPRQPAQTDLVAYTAEESAVLRLLLEGITDSGELFSRSHLDSISFNQALTMLELSRKIYSLGAGHWALTRA